MHPLLGNIALGGAWGPIPIHTYGFLIAVGFILAVLLVRKLAILSNLQSETVLDLTFWSFMVGFVGARLLFVITRLSYFKEDPVSIFRVWEGGLVFYGGPLVVIPFVWWFGKKHKLPAWKTADCMAPGLVLNHAFGRLGCLAAGCCYGKPTGSNYGVKLFSDLVDKHMQGIPLHPTQLYEAFGLIVLLAGLLWVFKHKKFDGQVALTYLMAYPIIRSVVEVYRGDLIRGFVIPDILSTSQFISLLVFLGAAYALRFRLKQVGRTP